MLRKLIKIFNDQSSNIKGCSIYKTEKHYKTLTLYRLESWVYIQSTPICILPIGVGNNILKDTIFNNIFKFSKEIKEYEEKEYKINEKSLLEKLKEPSFKKLYERSNSCNIYMKNNYLEIIPHIPSTNYKWLEEVKEDIIVMEYSPEKELEITEKIVEILNKSYK